MAPDLAWPHGRLVVAVALAALAGWPYAASAPRPSAPCPGRVVLATDDRLLCDPATLAALTRLCPPTAPIRPGDRIHPTLDTLRCRLDPRPLPAARRLLLGERLDINRARADELTQVRGIGPRTAAAIIAGRPWQRVDDLVRLRGIGPARLARLAPSLAVTPTLRPPLSPSSRRGASSPRRP